MGQTAKDLTHCKTKPEWCSYRRWRIELARRANPDRYEFAGMSRQSAARVNTGSHPKLGGYNY